MIKPNRIGVSSAMAPADRKGVLVRWAELIEEHADEIALLECLDVGKPISDTTGVDVPSAVRVGTMGINNYFGGDITVPFGGFKQSGNGRDKSLHALNDYTELKTTWVEFD